MKAVYRTVMPYCLDNSVTGVAEEKKKLYEKSDPWGGISQSKRDCVRDELLKMFEGECAFCGKRLYSKNADTQVDHFLPKGDFKFLSLCWENLILLCSDCNNIKRDFVPQSLKGKIFVEQFMSETTNIPSGANEYDKKQVFDKCDDRLIDPSFDDPSKHICFVPGSHLFMPLTSIGEVMVDRIFRRLRSLNERLEKLSKLVKLIIENDQPEQVLEFHISLSGYSFFMKEFYRYWLMLKKTRYK